MKKLLKTDNVNSLTENEIKVLNAGRTNCFSDCLESATWSFAVCDESGLDEKIYRGVVSSLIKKGYVWIQDDSNKGKFADMVFGYTEKGKSLFEE
jgi:hypothetical protein